VSTATIGEVLNRLRDEFDDITISKIRFLEAEGLISPDRTESGYRKFTEADVARLRYVLRAQRDRYLPLKVIKEELARIDAGLPPAADDAGPEVPHALRGDGRAADEDEQPSLLDAPDADVRLSDAELAEATGLEVGDVAALRDHSLLKGDVHDAHGLAIARIAAKLLAAGLEPRHLRMYRQFADREASLVEQRVGASLRQRNPDSRKEAERTAEQLVYLGGELHRALLADTIQQVLRS
jgi:DNA-binding transcriptional MerR regulator